MTTVNVNETTKKLPVISTAVRGEPNETNCELVLTFSNGKELKLQPRDLSTEVLNQAMLHGLKQKLVDAAAISCDPTTGRPATVDTKYDAVKEVFDRLLAGDWNKKRESGTQSGGLLFRALFKMYDGRKSEAEIKAFLANKTEAEKTALRKNERVAAIIAELRLPATSGSVDTDALLDELGE